MTETNRTTSNAEYCHTPLSNDLTLRPSRYWMSVKIEVWRPVPGWTDYAVSNWGRVRREVASIKAKAGRVLQPGIHKPNAAQIDGYKHVRLCGQGKPKTFSVHYLVALAFIRKEDEAANCVDHLNSDTLDNHAENLEWVSQAENCRRTKERGRYQTGDDHYTRRKPELRQIGERNHAAKITEDKAHEAKWLFANTDYTAKEISKMLDISLATCYHIKQGKRWAHLDIS